MLFATKEKVERKINRQLTSLEKVQSRLQVYFDQEKIVGDIFGPMPGLNEMRVACSEIYEGLIEAQVAVRFGQATPKQVASQLGPVDGAIRQFETMLAQMEAGSAQGRAAFKTRFGNS